HHGMPANDAVALETSDAVGNRGTGEANGVCDLLGRSASVTEEVCQDFEIERVQIVGHGMILRPFRRLCDAFSDVLFPPPLPPSAPSPPSGGEGLSIEDCGGSRLFVTEPRQILKSRILKSRVPRPA